MGQLIVLPRADRPSRPMPSPDMSNPDFSAEILFFTGVRYYRMTDEPAAPVVKTRRRRRSAPAKIAAKA